MRCSALEKNNWGNRETKTEMRDAEETVGTPLYTYIHN